jgi:hypothetical protein
MDLKPIEKLEDYIEAVLNFHFFNGRAIYRGQAQKGNLVPGIARKDLTLNTTEREKAVLHQIELMGSSLLSQGPMSELDLLVTAQHYGLKTRLLDWTSNPLIALWFACADRQVGDAFVYVLDAAPLLEIGIYDQDPFKVSHTRVFQPRSNNPRIIAQDGWFTLHRYSDKDQQFVPLEKNALGKLNLTELRIPENSRDGLVWSLDLMGVNNKTIFPDLEGLCKHMNYKHEL